MTPKAPRPNPPICPKRNKKNSNTYATPQLAITEARAFYVRTGERVYLFYCTDYPCAADRYIHWTRQKPNKKNAVLNRKLVNIYREDERAGTGTSEQRRRETWKRRRSVRKRVPFMTWEDDGGALHPRDLED